MELWVTSHDHWTIDPPLLWPQPAEELGTVSDKHQHTVWCPTKNESLCSVLIYLSEILNYRENTGSDTWE